MKSSTKVEGYSVLDGMPCIAYHYRMSYKKITRRVVLATFLCIIVANFFYGLFVPYILNYSPNFHAEFMRKVIIISLIVGPFAVYVVYRFYRPVGRLLKKLASGDAVTEVDYSATQKAFKNISTFLFAVGGSSFLIGLILNMLADIITGKTLDPTHFVLRFFTATIWGFLTGLMTTRVLNIVLIRAKLLIGLDRILTEKGGRRTSSTFSHILFPTVILICYVCVFSGMGFFSRMHVMQYNAGADAEGEAERTKRAITEMLLIETVLLVSSITLFAVALLETRSHLKNLNRQIGKLSETTMDLRGRIVIISYDDIGVAIAGINSILDNLQKAFSSIQDAVMDLSSGSEETEGVAGKSREQAARIHDAIIAAEKKAHEQSGMMEQVLRSFAPFLEELAKTIRTIESQNRDVDQGFSVFSEVALSLEKILGTAQEVESQTGLLKEAIRQSTGEIAMFTQTMTEMREAVASVNDSAGMVKDVADRTNILSINASIQAAQAGKSGAGFAVVAKEMRNLGDQVNIAVNRIDNVVRDINRKNDTGFAAIQKIHEALGSMQGQATRTQEIFTRLSAMAAQEVGRIRENIEQSARIRTLAAELRTGAGNLEKENAAIGSSIASATDASGNLLSIINNLLEGTKDVLGMFDSLNSGFLHAHGGIERLRAITARFRTVSQPRE